MEGHFGTSCKLLSVENPGTEIDHFTVVCSVTWPLNENESGVDLALIETSLFFLSLMMLFSC